MRSLIVWIAIQFLYISSLSAQKQQFRFLFDYPQYLSPVVIGNPDSTSISLNSTAYSFDIEKRGQTDISFFHVLANTNFQLGVNYFRLNQIWDRKFTNSVKASNFFELQGSYLFQMPNEALLGVGLEFDFFQRQGDYLTTYIGELDNYQFDVGLGMAYQKNNWNLYLGIESILSEDKTFTILEGLIDTLFFEERYRNLYLFATNQVGKKGKMKLHYGVYLSSLSDGLLQLGLVDKNDLFRFSMATSVTNGDWGWQVSASLYGPKKRKLYYFLSYRSLWKNFDPGFSLGIRYALKKATKPRGIEP